MFIDITVKYISGIMISKKKFAYKLPIKYRKSFTRKTARHKDNKRFSPVTPNRKWLRERKSPLIYNYALL